MDTMTIVIGVITVFIAILCFIYVSFAVRQKGPILTNEWLLGTEQERKKIDKKASYRQVTVVFGCFGIMFAFASIFIFTEWKWSLGVVFIVTVLVIVYAMVSGIWGEIKK